MVPIFLEILMKTTNKTLSTENSVYVRMSRDCLQTPLVAIALVTQRDPSEPTTRLVCSLYEAFYEA